MLNIIGIEHIKYYTNKFTLYKHNVFTWLSLFASIGSGALTGPIFKYIQNHNIQPILAVTWRCACMLFFLIPGTIIERILNKKKYNDFIKDYFITEKSKYPLILYVIISSIGWSFTLFFWVLSLSFTSIIHASVISNLHSLIIVIYMFFSGKNISKYEILGVLISICGIVISVIKSILETKSKSSILFGDCLCLLSAFGQVITILNKKNVRNVTMIKFKIITNIILKITALIISFFIEDNIMIFCIDNNCMLGWLSNFWLPKIMGFAFLINFCLCAFNYSVNHIDPLVVSSICLLDIPVTGILSWLIGIESIPDFYTWIGTTIVIFGIGFVSYGENTRTILNDSDIQPKYEILSITEDIEFIV